MRRIYCDSWPGTYFELSVRLISKWSNYYFDPKKKNTIPKQCTKYVQNIRTECSRLLQNSPFSGDFFKFVGGILSIILVFFLFFWRPFLFSIFLRWSFIKKKTRKQFLYLIFCEAVLYFCKRNPLFYSKRYFVIVKFYCILSESYAIYFQKNSLFQRTKIVISRINFILALLLWSNWGCSSEHMLYRRQVVAHRLD